MPAFLRAPRAKTLRSISVVTTLAVFVSGQLVPRTAMAGPSRTALLGLDAADSNVGRQVSDALADSLEARNALFRAPLTFAEYRLMMSCSPENNRCLGRAGEGFDAPQIMLGGLIHSGDEVQVNLRLIRNRSGALLAEERFTFKPEHLNGAKLMTSADHMVNSLFAEAAGKPLPAFPFAPVISKNSTSSAKGSAAQKPAQPRAARQAPPEERPVTGLVTPSPSSADLEPAKPGPQPDLHPQRSGVGNKVGLGVTLGLAAASFGTAFWLQSRLRKYGPIQKEIWQLASSSVSDTDSDPNNDVHPTRPDNLCDIARMPRVNEPGQVRNAEIARVCDKGDRMVTMNTVALVAGGVFTAGAAVFLGLVIRDSRAKRQRRLSFNGGWAPGQGGEFSARLRF